MPRDMSQRDRTADTGVVVDAYVEDRFGYEAERGAAEVYWASLSAQEQARELNWQIDMIGTNDPPPYWTAVAGRLVEEGSDEYYRLSLASRRSRFVGIVRPLIRVRTRGRARGGRRSSARSRARSPGRPGRQADDPDLADLGAAA
jgi:hypothetical protein